MHSLRAPRALRAPGNRVGRRTRVFGRAAGALCVLTSLAAVTGATGLDSPAGAATSGTTCSMSALTSHKGTVNLSFWESMVTQNGKTLTALTTAFNSSQKKVHVTLVQQKSYTTTWIKYQAGLSNGKLPQLVQLTSIDLQGVDDSRSVMPVQNCMAATHYATSDFVPRVLSAYKIGKTEIGMPFAVSGPVLIYNQTAFTADGITAPPATLTQLVADAAILKAHGSGMGLKLDPWHLETWLSSANQAFVNNGNGRTKRATKAVFDNSVAQKVWTDLDKLVSSGDAVTNPATGPDEYDNLLGIGTGQYGMTIDTTAVLGTVELVLSSGKYPGVSLGVAPFPAYSSKVKGGIEVGGSALYISNKSPAADRAAAWQYIEFLDSSKSQATWSKGTGYIPIRKSAAASAAVQGLWASSPGYKVAYEQLLSGIDTTATDGAVLGPYTQVRTAELNAEESMFQGGATPSAALSTAQTKINQIISQYNQRVGS